MNRGNFCPEISINLSRCLNSCVSNIGDKLNVMQKRLIEMICLVQGNEIFGRYLHRVYGLVTDNPVVLRSFEEDCQIGLCAEF